MKNVEQKIPIFVISEIRSIRRQINGRVIDENDFIEIIDISDDEDELSRLPEDEEGVMDQ